MPGQAFGFDGTYSGCRVQGSGGVGIRDCSGCTCRSQRIGVALWFSGLGMRVLEVHPVGPEEGQDGRGCSVQGGRDYDSGCRGQRPHGGVRPFHQKSTCLTELTVGPYLVHIWTRNVRNPERTERSNSTVWIGVAPGGLPRRKAGLDD